MPCRMWDGNADACGVLLGTQTLGQMTAGWSRVETVSMTLSDFHFTPHQLEPRRGTSYQLHLVNASTS